MPNYESKNCPRCESDFECKVSSIHECQCSNVFLTASEQDYVATLYDECLCVNCMIDVLTEYSIQKQGKKPEQTLRH